MGAGNTRQEDPSPAVFNFAESSGILPDIRIEQSLFKYSELDSADVLKQMSYTSELLRDVAGKTPTYAINLGSSIASLNSVPNAVGVGFVLFSFFLDLAILRESLNSDIRTLNMMRQVFAEEKASIVRDKLDECLRRLSMHVKEPNKVLEEIDRLEKQLSEQLTRLKNSMWRDDQMNSRSMKLWVNGAAFHSQMLIHAERIKKQIYSFTVSENRVSSIRTVIEHYQSDLQELLKKYKTYKKSTFTLEPGLRFAGMFGAPPAFFELTDHELGQTARTYTGYIFINDWEVRQYSMDNYVNYMFKNWDQVKKLEGYFIDLKNNIKELILQHQEFTMKTS